jgi:O-antigen/teichoic acid export membrane protein
LLASTLIWLLLECSDAVLLGYFHGSEEVAAFRAVLVVALLNQGVTFTFALLYTPTLAGLYAAGEADKISRLYWQATLWVTVLSFPVFLLTFSFAEPTTVGLLGAGYADSASIMAILALGYFLHLSLGFNGLTLRVHGRIRYSVSVDVAAAVLNVVVNLALIPRWGALGAAAGTTGTLVVHNLLKQAGLRRCSRIPTLPLGYVFAWLTLAGAAAALFLLSAAVTIPFWLALVVSAAAGVGALRAFSRSLDLETTFPQVARVPLMRILAPGGSS